MRFYFYIWGYFQALMAKNENVVVAREIFLYIIIENEPKALQTV